MWHFNTKVIDESKRLDLRFEILEKIGMPKNPEVALRSIGSIITLQHSSAKDVTDECVIRTIDNKGKLTLPDEFMEKMGWEIGEKVHIYVMGRNMVVMELDWIYFKEDMYRYII